MKKSNTGRGAILAVVGIAMLASALATTVRAAVISNVTATASHEETAPPARYATNAVNGYGLLGDAHTNAAGYMWQGWGTSEWFQVSLKRECRVDTMRVWNHNATLNYGVGLADIYTAEDPGTNSPGGPGWTLLQADRLFSLASGQSTYSTPDTVTVNRTTLHVGLKIKSSLGGNRVGLSEIQFLGAALPVRPIANVTATGSSYESWSGTPNQVVNGAGLIGEAHDTTLTNMWCPWSSPGQWLKVDLGRDYDVARMDVWNFNQTGGWAKRGMATVHIYTATTDPGTNPGGAGWLQVKTNQYFSIGPGAIGYNTPTRVIMHHRTRYIGISVLTSHDTGNLTGQGGLSEIAFYETPPPAGTIFTIR